MERPKLHTPIKSMRFKCLDCCAGSAPEVKKCECIECPLWLYRFGRRPSKEDKAALFDAKPCRSLPSGEIYWRVEGEDKKNG